MARIDRSRFSAGLANAAMLLYMVWLLLPAVQVTLHAATGAFAVLLFAVAALLCPLTRGHRLWEWVLRALCAAALPLMLFYFLHRGGGNLPAYLAQQGMFWFAPLWFAYARQNGDKRLYRWVGPLFLTLMLVTALTTLGWLVQGLLRGGKVYAYARSLGSGEPGNGAYLRELMGRNIGGYDFIYALVLLLPALFWLGQAARGWRRAGYAGFYALALAVVGLSQYTYAIVFAAAVTAAELLALLLRAVFKRLSVGASLLCALPFLAALWVLRVPLVTWAAGLATGFGFENAAYSLSQLGNLLTGAAVDAGSRLATYTRPLQGIAASPLVGSMLGGEAMLGMHSDLLDLLSGMGVLGTALFALAAWNTGRGAQRGLARQPAFAQLMLQWVLLLCFLALGTVFYSRELSLALCASYLLLARPDARLPAEDKSIIM